MRGRERGAVVGYDSGFGRGEVERGTVADVIVVHDVESAVELDYVAVVVAVPPSFVPALREVEYLERGAETLYRHGSLEWMRGAERGGGALSHPLET